MELISPNYPIDETKVIKNNIMREYKYKAITDGSDFEDYVIKLYEKEEGRLLDVFLHDPENNIYWAKEINGNIFYSIDQIFDTERQDATHLVIFMK